MMRKEPAGFRALDYHGRFRAMHGSGKVIDCVLVHMRKEGLWKRLRVHDIRRDHLLSGPSAGEKSLNLSLGLLVSHGNGLDFTDDKVCMAFAANGLE